ncbi:T9SS type B sorting domain-containing protein [Cellulophaga baltica]|uniref:T9SS type B sorting domain-containing protein n=1 Tax=Cellulophaga baltica TaxID=76594 RepID=UPI0015F6B1D6|nr:T9SS type B sorting domain-containing protein [Cellulophaga baltica]MBA6316821.1 T9SS type B sorting domain-containing protein [Cellulophaga baltica]
MRVYTLLLSLLLTCIIQAQVTPAEKAALQAFYTATGGSNWTSETDADPTNDWDFSGPVTNDWYGITISGGNVISINMNPTRERDRGNNLTGVIPNEIGDLNSLTLINLEYQNLSGSLPLRLYELNNLRFLYLSSNNFTDTISPLISQLSNLISIVLTLNDFNGEIPVELTTLTNLEELNLSINNFSGNIPIELTSMIQLKVLDLAINDFTGYLYPEYGKLINLEKFEILSNSISGNIPSEFGDMLSLKYIRLNSNDLDGELPVSLKNLINLESLNIGDTNISGTIPEEYGELINLKDFSLYQNQLSGVLPNSLSNLSKLTTFNVSFNQISGELPPSYSNWNFIRAFIASNNQLTGEIPESYSSFGELNNIRLDNNQLSGGLSPLFSNWSKVTQIGIHSNNFQNTLPDFTSNISLIHLQFNDNAFQFGDFEDEFNYYDQTLLTFKDNPQARVNDMQNLSSCAGSSITLSTVVSGNANVYQWLKDGTAIAGATNVDLVLNPVAISDAGVYTCLITSTIVTDLTLERNPITLTVNATGPIANIVEDKLACDLDADGFATFSLNLADIEAQAFGSQTGLTISYFDSLGNPLTLTNSYTNTTASNQVVTVRVSDTGGCYDESTFNLITTLPAVADTNADVTSCVNYTLPPLNADSNYFTATNASGTPLQEGAIINTTQTIYIHAGIGNCADETSFTVTIEQPVTADQLEDVTECEFYTLPPLTTSNYFTESNGQGTMINEGDRITETQTIYIYTESGVCSDESSFTISIDLLACENSEEAIKSKFPNFFTPNGDGTNDTWKVNQKLFLLKGTVTIYNRYGKLISQFDAINGEWDGYSNGRRLPASDYWYKFEGIDGEINSTGHFALKR